MLNRGVEPLGRQKRLAAVRSPIEIALVFSKIMTLRLLLSLSFTASVFLSVLHGESSPNVAASEQPNPAVAKSGNQEPVAKPAKPAAPASVTEKDLGLTVPVKKIKTTKPFILKSGMDDFPAKPVAEVRLFDGWSTFQSFTAGKLVVVPIGEFTSVVLPKDEPDFRQVLINHAASFGADYVLLVTDSKELQRVFPSPMNQFCYCARAYKRVTARLGIEGDLAAAKLDIVKIRGFAPGSLAEQGGLRVGDIVKKVDGETPGNNVYNNHLYWSKALHWKAGDKVKVEIEREGKIVELDVVLSAS